MDRRSTYMALIVATLAMSLVGAGITAFLSLDQPSSGYAPIDDVVSDDGTFPPGNDPIERNGDDFNGSEYPDSGEGAPLIGSPLDGSQPADERISPFLPAAAAVTLIVCLLFVAVTGRAYMESSRHENMVTNDLIDLINVNPGINLSTIRSELQLSQGAVSYHLRRLEKRGNIYSHKGLKERRYYPAGMGYKRVEDQSARDEIRSVISNPTASSILDLIELSPATQSDIVRRIGISASTVHWHMERLEKLGVVEKRRDGRSVVYVLKKDPMEN